MNTAKASTEDLRKNAQAHYDKVSSAAHEWLNTIPKAIDYYYDHLPPAPDAALVAGEECVIDTSHDGCAWDWCLTHERKMSECRAATPPAAEPLDAELAEAQRLYERTSLSTKEGAFPTAADVSWIAAAHNLWPRLVARVQGGD